MWCGSTARADTPPQDILRMLPQSAVGAVIVPNLKFCSDEITRCLEGMDRSNLLLGSRPLDQLKSWLGVNAGVNDVGAAAVVGILQDDEPQSAFIAPVNDPAAFLANFTEHVQGDAYRRADGSQWFVRVVNAYALIAPNQATLDELVQSATAMAGSSALARTGAEADAVLGRGEILLVLSKTGARQMFTRAADVAAQAQQPQAEALQRVQALADQIRLNILAIDFDPLAIVIRTLGVLEDDSSMAEALRTGEHAGAPVPAHLDRLPNKPFYLALSLDRTGAGAGMVASLLGAMNVHFPQWIEQARSIQAAVYPSPAGLAGGVLNDALLVLQTPQPAAALEALKTQLTNAAQASDIMRGQLTWTPAKNINDITAESYELRLADDQDANPMVQMFWPMVFGRNGWRGFVKTTDDSLIMTFSQRPAVLESALKASANSIGSSGMVKTMRQWMPKQRDLEAYVNLGQLMQLIDQATRAFPMAQAPPLPQFEPNAPPIGFAVGTGSQSVQSSTIIPAAVTAALLDWTTGAAMGKNQPNPHELPGADREGATSAPARSGGSTP
jgi:hypothetical protein